MPELQKTSDQIHNENCFNYLKNIALTNLIKDELPKHLVAAIESVEYQADVAYGDLYKEFFEFIEEHIDRLYGSKREQLSAEKARITEFKNLLTEAELNKGKSFVQEVAMNAGVLSYIKNIKPETNTKPDLDVALERKIAALTAEIKGLDQFVASLYHNDNKNLENTFQHVQELALIHQPSFEKLEKSLSIPDGKERINRKSMSPAVAGSMFGRFTTMISDDFKPQHTTSIATVRRYEENQDYPTEFRIGTQGQRHKGKARVSPLFKNFLRQQELNLDIDDAQWLEKCPITHIYFNNLGRDREDMEGLKERGLTLKLEELEKDHPNVAVITLPADKGLMNRYAYTQVKPKFSLHEIKAEFLDITLERQSSKIKIRDFHISDLIRRRAKLDEEQIKALIEASFKAQGFEETASLTGSQKQAVWFHFIKYELPNFLITQLKPQSINFSCKDAIDRGGVSSAYYNLMRALKDYPNTASSILTREGFEQALHAAPVMVKARGMNFHIHLIWNAVDSYINAHYENLKNKDKEALRWLIEWRDANCPHERVASLIQLRAEQLTAELTTPAPGRDSELCAKAINVLNAIRTQNVLGVSGKRLMLEALTSTAALALHPEKQSPALIKRYRELIHKLEVAAPLAKIIGGAMKAFLGAIVYLFSGGKKQDVLESGLATMIAGVNAHNRSDLQEKMRKQLGLIRSEEAADVKPSLKPN